MGCCTKTTHFSDAGSKVDLNSRLGILIACVDANSTSVVFDVSSFNFQLLNLVIQVRNLCFDFATSTTGFLLLGFQVLYLGLDVFGY